MSVDEARAADRRQCARTVLMVRPATFYANPETLATNAFQHVVAASKADTLRAAQAEPEKYRDLIVRVAGYSDYFCDLTAALQNEIIARTEQAAI